MITEERQVIDPALTEDTSIAQAVELVETAAYTEAQLAAYHKALDVARIETSALGDARAEGEAIGEARGEAIGEARGKAEGKAEGDLTARLSVAAAMRVDGLSVEKVAALTGLTFEQVRAL